MAPVQKINFRSSLNRWRDAVFVAVAQQPT
jgi:hypothetical protein